MDYYHISQETFDLLYQSRNSLKNSPLDQQLKSLIELYVSKINFCEYCIRIHTNEASKTGASKEKIEALSDWENSDLFSETEKVALRWAQVVTELDSASNIEMLKPHFSEKEIVDLTTAISLMNALNRVAIYLRP